jgi:hypothetical protein
VSWRVTRTDTESVQLYGKGIEKLHVDPREIVQLRFQVDQPGDDKFQYDLHHHMQGELLLLYVEMA